MITMTMVSSINVKPLCLRRSMNACVMFLPILVLGAIECSALKFTGHVEDIVAAPGIGGGIVLHVLQLPLGFVSKWVDGNGAKKADFLALHIDAVHQCLEIRRITFRTDFDLE